MAYNLTNEEKEIIVKWYQAVMDRDEMQMAYVLDDLDAAGFIKPDTIVFDTHEKGEAARVFYNDLVITGEAASQPYI